MGEEQRSELKALIGMLKMPSPPSEYESQTSEETLDVKTAKVKQGSSIYREGHHTQPSSLEPNTEVIA